MGIELHVCFIYRYSNMYLPVFNHNIDLLSGVQSRAIIISFSTEILCQLKYIYSIWFPKSRLDLKCT